MDDLEEVLPSTEGLLPLDTTGIPTLDVASDAPEGLLPTVGQSNCGAGIPVGDAGVLGDVVATSADVTGHVGPKAAFLDISSCFDDEGKLYEGSPLKELLNVTGIQSINDLSAICVAIKKLLVIGERQDKQSTDAIFAEKREQIIELASQLGFMRAKDSTSLDNEVKEYEAAIIHGAHPGERFKALMEAYKNGVSIDQVFVITTNGVPVLEAGLTELENMQKVFKDLKAEYEFENPENENELGGKAVYWLDTPTPEGLSRAHTPHTIVKLVEELKSRGIVNEIHNIIGVSNQPFVQYQNEQIKIIFGNNGLNIKVHDLGIAWPDVSISTLLDSISKTIFFKALERDIAEGINLEEKYRAILPYEQYLRLKPLFPSLS